MDHLANRMDDARGLVAHDERMIGVDLLLHASMRPKVNLVFLVTAVSELFASLTSLPQTPMNATLMSTSWGSFKVGTGRSSNLAIPGPYRRQDRFYYNFRAYDDKKAGILYLHTHLCEQTIRVDQGAESKISPSRTVKIEERIRCYLRNIRLEL